MLMKKVFLQPPDSSWLREFDNIKEELLTLPEAARLQIHHIGSTSIKGIYAKPIIDIMVDVKSYKGFEHISESMVRMGFTAKGEHGIPGRRYFSRTKEHMMAVHVHFFESGDPNIAHHLAFRDYLNAQPAIAQNYSELKRELARTFPLDRDRYQLEKSPFIEKTIREALRWRAQNPQ